MPELLTHICDDDNQPAGRHTPGMCGNISGMTLGFSEDDSESVAAVERAIERGHEGGYRMCPNCVEEFQKRAVRKE